MVIEDNNPSTDTYINEENKNIYNIKSSEEDLNICSNTNSPKLNNEIINKMDVNDENNNNDSIKSNNDTILDNVDNIAENILEINNNDK